MTLTIETASEPHWVDEQQTAIALQVTFSELPDPMPYCAMADDPEAHGRAIFERAVTEAQHCEMMCDQDAAQAWRTYYQQLHALESAPEWPQVAAWPTPPDGEG